MRKNFDLSAIRKRLSEQEGRTYWRSLDELADTEEFQDLVEHEFPQGADQWLNPVTRRNFLKLMGASLALGGLSACAPGGPPEEILPYVRAPEEVVPGLPLFYATAMSLGGIATGLLAESHMGRPTKIEGNPEHPASLGATDVYQQASVLTMWDPDRAKTINNISVVNSWDAFVSSLNLELAGQRGNEGAGVRLLTETITSPTLGSMITAFLQEFPQAQWIQYEPINRDNLREGNLLALGEDVNVIYDFSQADVVLSLDADFMAPGPIGVRYARDFMDKRRVREGQTAMNRLYVAEAAPSVTGSMADHHLSLSPANIEGFVRALAAELGVDVDAPAEVPGVPGEWIPAIAADLQANTGNSIVMAGLTLPPAVHAIVHAINGLLGNNGSTVLYTDPLEIQPSTQTEDLRQLVEDMNNGDVDVLVIIEANPVYNAPGDLDFVAAMDNVAYRARMGLYEDETSAYCQWNVPLSHYLESWGDARAYDGTITLTQPLIEPLYDSHTPYELFASLTGQGGVAPYDLLTDYWSQQGLVGEADFGVFWRTAVRDGFIAGTALSPRTPSVSTGGIPDAVTPATGLQVLLRPDPSMWDGRFANNGWLYELPKPLSKITWDNTAQISPNTAQELGLSLEDLIDIEHEGRTIRLPVWISPGQSDGTVLVTLGYGRERVGRVGNGVGANAYRIRSSSSPWLTEQAQVQATGSKSAIASTQNHYNMLTGYQQHDRYLVRTGTIQHFEEDPEFVEHLVHEVPFKTLMPGWEYNSYAWGMVVDLNVCNGCNACVVACQAENNIPVVGKSEVFNGREMHWMRVDTYFSGNLDTPDFVNQPMMCHHCEQAPCELVCPVNATVHDHEGLNVMVYNRCIGTRYCSNNCPYKVRRYNFFYYHDDNAIALQGQKNPDVTVRTRGVMEKCTYCIQRISAARIEAKNNNRRIADGEVLAACQQACPTNAIVFGDTNDPDAAVSELKQQPHNYTVLADLGTLPRTSYLARFRNPNPDLEDPLAHAGENGHG